MPAFSKRKTLPRRSPESRKQLIVDAAAEILSDRQYEDVPVSEIVKKAGVAQGTFYLYFPTKQAILQAIGDRVMSRIEVQLEKVAAEQPNTIAFVREMHAFAYKTMRRFRGLLSILDSDKLFFAKAALSHHEPPAILFETLTGLIRRDQKAGRVPQDLDPGLGARFIVSIIDRFMRDMRSAGQGFPAEAYTEQMLAFITRGLGFKEK